MPETRRQIPVRDGLWTTPSTLGEIPRLIGNRCCACGEVFFPKNDYGICTNCQARDMEELKLSRRGKIYSFSVVMLRPPVYYKGPVPYAEGFIELPEGVRVQALFTGCDFDELKVGMDVEMVIETLHEDEEGNEVVAYKFTPVKSQVEG